MMVVKLTGLVRVDKFSFAFKALLSGKGDNTSSGFLDLGSGFRDGFRPLDLVKFFL